MNKQEATVLRETILRELPDGFTCGEIIDSSKYNRDIQEVEPIFWFSIRKNEYKYPFEVMSVHSPEHWELLKRFSLAYVEGTVDNNQNDDFDPNIFPEVLDRV